MTTTKTKPKLKYTLPTQKIILPLSKKNVEFRPFTVREEKILLTAKETKDTDAALNSIMQIANNCITDDDVNPNNLPLTDIMWLILMVRGASVSNVFEFSIYDNDTEEYIELEMSTDDFKIVIPEDHSTVINVDADTILVMNYPTFSMLDNLDLDNNEDVFILAMKCIANMVEDGDQVTYINEYSEEEISEFIDGLPGHVYKEIENFFDTLPYLEASTKYKNKNNEEKTFTIRGVESFFT